MATLYISEYIVLGSTRDGNIPVAPEPPLAEQTVPVSGTSAQSSAFNAQTKYIGVRTDAVMSVLVGANPTATAAKKRLPADHTEYFAVQGGHKIAAITNT